MSVCEGRERNVSQGKNGRDGGREIVPSFGGFGRMIFVFLEIHQLESSVKRTSPPRQAWDHEAICVWHR